MRDIELFSNGAIYHVYGRGADRRTIFLSDADRLRFCKSMLAFNDRWRIENCSLSRLPAPMASDNPCVDIMAYCLMPNHFHLMLRQVADGGVSAFMHRLCGGYSRYFNRAHGRKGVLFESAYKAKRITTTVQMRHLPRYIHLNPLELAGMDYKSEPIERAKAEKFLDAYRWSSYRHYVGIECQLFVKHDESMPELNGNGHRDYLGAWVERDWKTLDALGQG